LQNTASISVVVPCYNEERLLAKSIARVLALKDALPHLEVIIVDDASLDRSHEVAAALAAEHPCIRVIRHDANQGKGAALRTGFAAAGGEVICIHDADLEYDPRDLLRMYKLIGDNEADVVFGTRFLSGEARRVLYFWHSLANKIITLACNVFTDLNMTDIECCYKMFKRDILRQIVIEENRFGVEPELVSKCARLNKKSGPIRIYEIAIAYHGRTYAEGKKIGPKDAVRALWVIFKYNLLR
jgi:dolichol-phosphate mannosyltransferase